MSKLSHVFLFLAVLGFCSPALATTISYGANITVEDTFSGEGFETGIFLELGEEFSIYFDNSGISVSGATTSYTPDLFTVYGRIEDSVASGDYFVINPGFNMYTADYAGSLFLYNKGTMGVAFENALVTVSLPATIFLFISGLLLIAGKHYLQPRRASNAAGISKLRF